MAKRKRGNDDARGAPQYIVAKASDVPPGSRLLVNVDRHEIAVFNVDGKLYAVLNRCPHRGGALGMGNIVSAVTSAVPGKLQVDTSMKLLVCPWHRWEFDIETGQSWCDAMDPARRRYVVKPFAVEVAAGSELAASQATDVEVMRPAEAKMVDPETHRVKGPHKATMFPVEVDDDYIVVTLARREAERGPQAN